MATQLAASEIERSRTEGSERFEQLANARILAQKARTDETLELIARSDITAGEKSFNGHIDELGKLLDAAPAAAKDGVQKWIASHRKQAEAYEGGDYDAGEVASDRPVRSASSPPSNPACATGSSERATHCAIGCRRRGHGWHGVPPGPSC